MASSPRTSAAVTRADLVVGELEGRGVPYCVCAASAPEGITGPLVSQEQVVSTLVRFLAPLAS